jgi:hypothetical protein
MSMLGKFQTDNLEKRFGHNHVIFLTGKNIKLSQFIQHDKNKSQPPLIHIHRESIIKFIQKSKNHHLLL